MISEQTDSPENVSIVNKSPTIPAPMVVNRFFGGINNVVLEKH